MTTTTLATPATRSGGDGSRRRFARRNSLRRGTDTLNGGRLVMDLNTGISSVDGRAGGSSSAVGGTTSSGGRVSGTFSVPKSSD